MKKMMNRDYPLSPTPEFDSYGSKPPKNKKELKNAAAEPTIGKDEKKKGRLTRGIGLGAVVGYAIGDIVNTQRRLTGKSYIPTKNKP